MYNFDCAFRHKLVGKDMFKTLLKLICSILWILAFLKLSAYAQGEGGQWTLSKETKTITVYRKSVPGLDIDAFKGVCEHRVRLEVLGSVLENIPGFVKWIDYLTESRVVKKNNENHLFLYQRYDVIWPFSDRDCVGEVHVDRNYKAGKFEISIHSVSNPQVPLSEDVVRLPVYIGTFIIEYIDRENTRITYIGKFDFGGFIPAWFSNFLSSEIPIRMLNGLIKEALKEEYIRAAETSELRRKLEESIKNGDLKQ